MNLGASTVNYSCPETADFDRAIQEIVADGFGVELFQSPPEVCDRDRWPRIKELIRDAPWISIHTKVYSWDEEALKEEIDLCSFLGGTVVVVHPNTLGLTTEDTDFRAIRAIADYAASAQVTIALENGEMDKLRAALDGAGGPGLAICLDVGHANKDYTELDDPVAAFFDEFRNQIIHFHIHDNHGESDEHLPPGQGTIDWDMVCAQISALNPPPQCVLEINPWASFRQTDLTSREFLSGK